jgi:hypothetical protein
MSVLQAHGNLSEAKSSIQAIAETQSKLDNPGAAIPSAIKIDGSAEIDLLGDTQQKPVDIPHSPDTVSDFQKVNEIRVSLFRKWPCAIPPDPFNTPYQLLDRFHCVASSLNRTNQVSELCGDQPSGTRITEPFHESWQHN